MVDVPPVLRLLPKLFKARSWIPDVKVPDFRQVDFHALRRAGYRGVVVDKDNCLTRPYDDALVPHLRPAWEECKAAFGPGRVLIVSNSSGTKSDPSGLGAEALHRETGVPVLIHAHKKPLCAADVDAYFGALPPALPLRALSAEQEQKAALAPGPGLLECAGGAVGQALSGLGGRAREDGRSTEGPRNLGLVVIGDRLMTDVLLTGLLAVPPPSPAAAGLPSSSVVTPPAAPLPSGAATASSTAPSFPAVVPAPPRALPYNLSLLLTTLPQPADVRPLRFIERLLETLARRRLGRPLAADLVFWRAADIVRPEPAPPAPVPLEGWRKAASMAGTATGWVAGELGRGLRVGGAWVWARGKAAWAAREERRAAEREVREKGERALAGLAKEDVEAAVLADRARLAERPTVPVLPQLEAEVRAVKA